MLSIPRQLLFSIPDKILTRHWSPYSRLIVCGDGSNWVLSEIAKELTQVCGQLGINVLN